MFQHQRRCRRVTSNHSDPRVVVEIGGGAGDRDRTTKEMVDTDSNRGMEEAGGQATVVAEPMVVITTNRRGLINYNIYTQRFGI